MKPSGYNRFLRLKKRKERLGERYTSDWTARKFFTDSLKETNPDLDLNKVEYIYQLGWCSGKEEYLHKLKELIRTQKFKKISKMNGDGVEWVQDDLGDIPIGEIARTYVFKRKDGTMFIQVGWSTFERDGQGKQIKFEQEIKPFDIQSISKRKLMYPI